MSRVRHGGGRSEEAVEEKRATAATEIARLRRRVEGEVGRAAAWTKWSRPLAAALCGLTAAFALRRLVRKSRRRPDEPDASE